MPSATVRRAMTAGALTAVLTLSLSAQASADAGDEDIVRMKFTGYTTVDTAPKHMEPGAGWVTYQDLYSENKKSKGKKFLGDASARCVAVHADEHRLTTQCTRVLRLKGGEITLHDMVTRVDDKPITAKTAIAGGTGLYNDAEGEGYITQEGDRVHYDLYIDD
ncbi:hypothetical protein ACFS5L_42515 [Streptomyces phyllanthi]|uniref:Uncharacterized protein n=1 Tax=Streptomyces phyllanthi TaxID=1803180 RepID=A0A5N8VUS6_9ACTN|nr:hypothetical protein [Streptomyces phyllanthi]MPY39031.1 hypothetical protein [Streptomyces phyllanthi]